MTDLEKRAHDLALLYIKAEIDAGRLKLPNVDELRELAGHYAAQYDNFLDELKYFQQP